MIPAIQISRQTLVWLFIAQIMVFLPHYSRMPIWLAGLLLVCIVWRVQVYRGHWSYPRRPVKFGLLGLAILFVLLSFPRVLGLEAMVAFLFVAYSLKLLEMYSKRDALVVIYLSLFILMTGFLFDQNILLALYNFITVIVVMTCMIGLNQEKGYVFPLRTFRMSTAMLLQSVPLMVVMFLVLPRLPAFWNVPVQQEGAKTGVSDTMSPGNFVDLTRSDELVMRVTFNGEKPIPQQLYWRGLVFSNFDGRTWRQAEPEQLINRGLGKTVIWYESGSYRFRNDLATMDFEQGERVLDYEVILEETHQPWLFALGVPVPETDGVGLVSDFRLLKQGPVTTRFKYNVYSYPDAVIERDLPQWRRELETAIPEAVNPRSRELATRWYQEAGSDEAYVEKLLDYFNQSFYYTLQPPALGNDSVDEFLFDSQRGFCEHFASSFTFMLRAVEIPARVVAGYQGGEANPYQDYMLVRQYDAHAWTEVWIKDKGWVRYDPTFAVAPERILDGFSRAFEGSEELATTGFGFDDVANLSMFYNLQLQFDRLNYLWARWVLGYDAGKQKSMLEKLLGAYSVARLAMVFLAFSVGFLVLVYLYLLWRERDRTADPAVRLYRRLLKKLSRAGVEIHTSDTPLDIAARSGVANAQELESIMDDFNRLFYQTGRRDRETLDDLSKRVRQWRGRMV